MTLDDETAANIARGVVGGGKATRVYPHSTDVALVRAGYAARDAEVEELRAELDILRERQAEVDKNSEDSRTTANLAYAQRERMQFERDAALATLAKVRQWAEALALQPDPPADDEVAGQINAAGDILAILDESPTERETPADEPIAKRLTHTYMGDCPDEVNGWESRDPECPACRALMEVVPDDRA